MPQRERITITIREDLLHSLDRTIDHQRIRNRSHALEVVLARALHNDTHQAVILASGQGVKMRPFTYEIPKPLIPVNGKPLLEYGIVLLRNHGIKNILITVSHLAHKIEQHFGDGSNLGVNITYVKERKPTGTGGALLAAHPHLEPSPFLLLYSDVLLNLDLTEFLQFHLANKAAVGTLALTSVVDPSAFGAVKLRGSRIVEFSEKPVIANDTSRLVFSGCAAFDYSVFNFIKKQTRPLSLEKDIFPELTQSGRLFGYPFEDQWFDVSTPEVYDQVIKQWRT
ncbi:MAG: hypothetical protein A3E37_03120 [Candidatus Andersenbacteria bacterium RIFCSPHIGHO2_12_FULL_46_9]|nr:MAG: Nucleotidyl transferase [Parcubacteria group bacterium GW2011_GWA2_45_14]OGY35527.1 MAG: hypothetical protein A3B76_02000 [Candidatus Andersenbacteria bacterium RIFCSPHIGHO2_02_FULL_46_16]OGY37710.1 MAG: hypothetical protein A3E37_03120 [Candidatus Andersenbacteria bacterium RIFCSPHIGHO2_12_FULL_46_9]OGY41501.1 MAG: hypothetical protein A3G57_00725 [Candidatus Andersenbacteria bacterium RIFCSPLOWO2_12_FULL_45_8]HBE90728.1 hypothetical protein [Candidatus Andersenbacteria bacterium]